jgi:hypothetical protein
LFAVPEKAASKIALGAAKNTIATIEGDYVTADHEQNRTDFIRFMDDPAWTQVSMNPERHSFYYDLETQTPVVSFGEAIQVGNLVIAKDVTYADVDDFSFIKNKQINHQRLHFFHFKTTNRPRACSSFTTGKKNYANRLGQYDH